MNEGERKMSEASESTTSDKSNRDQYLSEVKALYIESKAPLDQRDNRFFDSTLKLFRQAGKSRFDHRVWRESKMLPEMIMLHQKRYIGIKPP